MKNNTFLNTGLLLFIVTMMNACAFIPTTVPEPAYSQPSCETVTSELDIEVITFNGSGFHCQNEGCAAAFVALPIITAAVTLPLVAIGNTVNYIERQFRCD